MLSLQQPIGSQRLVGITASCLLHAQQVHEQVQRQQARPDWAGSALAVLCGDFNLVPLSPINNYLAQGSINLQEYCKHTLSGE